MGKYKTILFDLDGTLADSKPGVMWSLLSAMRDLGIEAPPKDRWDELLGPPLKKCFTDICGLAPEPAEKAVTVYRSYYQSKGLYNVSAYKGIDAVLKALHDKGYKLGVATSKAVDYAYIVLDAIGLSDYFDVVAGPPLKGLNETKADSIRRAMGQLPGSDHDNTVLIGDRMYDAQGAKDAGIGFIGVLYGYGTRQELSAYSPEALAETPEKLLQKIESL